MSGAERYGYGNGNGMKRTVTERREYEFLLLPRFYGEAYHHFDSIVLTHILYFVSLTL